MDGFRKFRKMLLTFLRKFNTNQSDQFIYYKKIVTKSTTKKIK